MAEGRVAVVEGLQVVEDGVGQSEKENFRQRLYREARTTGEIE
jgi:hypothetical protein